MHNSGHVTKLVILVDQRDQPRAQPISEGIAAELAHDPIQCYNPRLPLWTILRTLIVIFLPSEDMQIFSIW